ncbi:MAG: hypothetical protein RR330_06970 [Alistipes sp.]
MKLRRIIASWMLFVYLFMVGGMAWTVMFCPCLTQNAAHTICCSCTLHQEDHPHDAAHLHFDQKDCCGHDHDSEIALYTFTDNNSRTDVRYLAVDLLSCVIPQTTDQIIFVSQSVTFITPPSRLTEARYLLAVGMRAPPVMA